MTESRSMRYRVNVKVLGAIAVVAFLVVWLGIPTYQKWRADRLVDELCAKDGGIKVYEKVKLPPDKFNKFGEIRLPSKEDMKPNDEFYYTTETQWIVAGDESIYDFELYRYHISLYRRSGGELLAEGIGYTRRGGDPVGPWHSSSYMCPKRPSAGIKYINQRVFIENR